MKNLKQTLLAPLYMLCAGALVVASCVSETDPFASKSSDQEVQEGKGTLQIQLQGTDVTRATTPVSANEAKNYWITIYQNGVVHTQATQLSSLSSLFDAGYGYSLMAESCREADAEGNTDNPWGKPRYVGKSQSFAIVAGQTTTVPVTCKVANGGVTAYFDESITQNSNFSSGYSITINEKFPDGVTDRTLVFSDNSETVAYFNIPDGGREIECKVKAGDVEKTITQQLEVAKIKRLSVSYMSGSFSLEINVNDEEIYGEADVIVDEDPTIKDVEPTITTTHVYNNGILEGTTLTATDPSYYAGSTDATEWSAVVKNGDNVTVRTLSSGKGLLTSGATDVNWPYLPAGNYVLEYTFVNCKGKTETKSKAFTVLEPNIEAKLNALTSYSYATGDGTAKNIAQANACENKKIYAPTVTINVSEALAQNNNYGLTTTFNTNNQTQTKAKTAVFADYTVNDLKAYSLSATVAFAGRNYNANKTVYITGIPYTANPPSSSDWTSSGNVDWNSDHARLGAGTAGEQSIVKSFYVPGNVDVEAQVSAYTHGSAVGTTYTFYIAGVDVHHVTVNGTTSEDSNVTKQGTLTSSNSTVKCNNSYGMGLTHTKIYKVSVNYR